MSCGGKHLHIATLMRKYTRGLSTSTRPDLVVPAAETVLTDGRTDVKKKVRFWKKKSFLFGRVQTGRIFPYFGRIFPYFRTPSGRPSAKKGTFEEKKAFACLRCMGKSSKDKLSPKLSNAPACPQLSVETYPHARAIMKEQSASKNQSKEDRNHGIKHVNENQYFGNLCSCTFKQPKQKWHLQQ